MSRKAYYNETNTCDRCREEGRETKLSPGKAYKEYDKNRDWTGKWDCNSCYQKYNPNSYHNKLKLEADCRNNNLDPYSRPGKGYITATLVKKFLGIEDCFDITGNFNYRGYDMIEHEDWGLIDAKGSSLLSNGQCNYVYHSFNINKNKKADFFFCIGYGMSRKHVLVVLIIPNETNIGKLQTLMVPYDRESKYSEYNENEKEVKKWDDLFHTMKLNSCSVLRNNFVKIEEYYGTEKKSDIHLFGEDDMVRRRK